MRVRIAYALMILSVVATLGLSITSRVLHPHYTDTELVYRCWWVYPPLALTAFSLWLVRNER